jgi:hypothetical protein
MYMYTSISHIFSTALVGFVLAAWFALTAPAAGVAFKQVQSGMASVGPGGLIALTEML